MFMSTNDSDHHYPAIQNAFQGGLGAHLQALPQAWQDALADEPTRRVLQEMDAFLDERLAQGLRIFPLRPFRALLEVAPQDVQVVILGQDPYHGPNQAQGLAFSVPDRCPAPPSLLNMFAELSREYPDTFTRQRNSLIRWARRGALLLNTSLTVEAHKPASHAKRGWEAVTDAILARVLREPRPKAFLLWGSHAQSKQALLDSHPPQGPLLVLKANHPSPLSALRPPRPFIGCGHFLKANEWLREHGETGIDWLENRVPPEPPPVSQDCPPAPAPAAPDALPADAASMTMLDALNPLQVTERATLIQLLDTYRWNISNVAKALGISRNTLYRKLHRLCIPLSSQSEQDGVAAGRQGP